MKQKSLLLITFIIIFTIITKMNAQSLTWLGTLGGSTSKAIDVSDDGLIVVGISQNSQERYLGFKWTESTGMVSLGTLGGNFSNATGITNIGQRIVGTSVDSFNNTRAYIYRDGAMFEIDSRGSDHVVGNNISADGNFVVGSYQDSSLNDRAYYSQGASLNDIGTLGGVSSEAYAISDGIYPIIVGLAQTSNFEFHAFKKATNQMIVDLGSLGGDFSKATNISDNRDFIVGYSNGSNHGDHAFIWTTSGGMQDLGTLGGNSSEAYSVSDNGIVVGTSRIVTGFPNAFIWSADSGMQNLNTLYSNLIPATGELTIARSITMNGRYIVGTGYQSNPELQEAFLLYRGNLTTVDDNKDIPIEFSLAQNYPNPFNPSTRISFSIPKEEFVSLIVYNSLGEEVAELVKETKSAGNYSVTFDASGLSSGVYIYRLSTGASVQMKKMILNK